MLAGCHTGLLGVCLCLGQYFQLGEGHPELHRAAPRAGTVFAVRLTSWGFGSSFLRLCPPSATCLEFPFSYLWFWGVRKIPTRKTCRKAGEGVLAPRCRFWCALVQVRQCFHKAFLLVAWFKNYKANGVGRLVTCALRPLLRPELRQRRAELQGCKAKRLNLALENKPSAPMTTANLSNGSGLQFPVAPASNPQVSALAALACEAGDNLQGMQTRTR